MLRDGVGAKSKRVDGLHKVRYIELFLALPEMKAGRPVAAVADYEQVNYDEALSKPNEKRYRCTACSTSKSLPLDTDDWRGALGVFLLVSLSTFPVTIPFIVMAGPVRLCRRM